MAHRTTVVIDPEFIALFDAYIGLAGKRAAMLRAQVTADLGFTFELWCEIMSAGLLGFILPAYTAAAAAFKAGNVDVEKHSTGFTAHRQGPGQARMVKYLAISSGVVRPPSRETAAARTRREAGERRERWCGPITTRVAVAS